MPPEGFIGFTGANLRGKGRGTWSSVMVESLAETLRLGVRARGRK